MSILPAGVRAGLLRRRRLRAHLRPTISLVILSGGWRSSANRRRRAWPELVEGPCGSTLGCSDCHSLRAHMQRPTHQPRSHQQNRDRPLRHRRPLSLNQTSLLLNPPQPTPPFFRCCLSPLGVGSSRRGICLSARREPATFPATPLTPDPALLSGVQSPVSSPNDRALSAACALSRPQSYPNPPRAPNRSERPD